MTNYSTQAEPRSIYEYVSRYLSDTVSAAGPTELVATPGIGRRIVVTSFVVQNESQVATTIILQDGGHERWRCYASGPGNGLSKDFPPNRPWHLRENQPLIINLSGANACGYSLQYHVERV